MSSLSHLTKLLHTVACLVLVTLWAPQATADSSIYRRALAGTVLIVAENSMGSGALVNVEQRLVVTSNHVVSENSDCFVFFPVVSQGEPIGNLQYYVDRSDKLALAGTVIQRDVQRDLAIVQLSTLPAEVTAFRIAGQRPSPGERIHTIGNSGAINAALWRYSTGTVRQSYFHRAEISNGVFTEARVIETQLPINPGDSGGPILNDQGELVGVNFAFSQNENAISFGVDIAEALPLLARVSTPQTTAPPVSQSESPAPSQSPATTIPPPVNHPDDVAPEPVGRLLQGRSWLSRASTVPNQEEYWITTFRCDGTFTDQIVDPQGNCKQRTDGRFRVQGNQLTMTNAQGSVYWTGRIETYNDTCIAYIAPGSDPLYAVKFDLPNADPATTDIPRNQVCR